MCFCCCAFNKFPFPLVHYINWILDSLINRVTFIETTLNLTKGFFFGILNVSYSKPKRKTRFCILEWNVYSLGIWCSNWHWIIGFEYFDKYAKMKSRHTSSDYRVKTKYFLHIMLHLISNVPIADTFISLLSLSDGEDELYWGW